MASFVSKDGKWLVRMERVGLKNYSDQPIPNPSTDPKYAGEIIQPGEDFIYHGPDRDAMNMLAQAGEESFGNDFRDNPDLITKVRQLGYKNVDEYAKIYGYDSKKAQEMVDKEMTVVNKHTLPLRVQALKVLAGGQDFSNSNNSSVGGFGTEHWTPLIPKEGMGAMA